MRDNETAALVWIGIGIYAWYWYSRRFRSTGGEFGTAAWMTEQMLRSAVFKGTGLVLGRTLKGSLIRLPNVVIHTLLIGGTGSGKTAGIILCSCLTYGHGFLFIHDTKGDIWKVIAARKKRSGIRIIRIAPFNGGTDGLNPFDTIPRESPLLVDWARAMAEAIVVRQGTEPDPHWQDKAVQVITALIVLVLLTFNDDERNLCSVQDIACDPEMVKIASKELQKLGGIPARLGNQLKALFDKEGGVSKEGAGILSSVSRALSWLDSELIDKAVRKSTFSVSDLRPGTVVLLQVDPEQLEAQRGYLRLILTTLFRAMGKLGCESLAIIDEASVFCGLPAMEEVLIRGRSSGIRLLAAYQSDAQARTAFKDKPTLLYDNCNAQIFLGASSIESAERISKCLGSYTQTVLGYGGSSSRSWNDGPGSHQRTAGDSRNYSQSGRPLLMGDEILRMSDKYLIALIQNMPPILAQRIRWYSDQAFNPAVKRAFRFRIWWLIPAVLVIVFCVLRLR